MKSEKFVKRLTIMKNTSVESRKADEFSIKFRITIQICIRFSGKVFRLIEYVAYDLLFLFLTKTSVLVKIGRSSSAREICFEIGRLHEKSMLTFRARLIWFFRSPDEATIELLKIDLKRWQMILFRNYWKIAEKKYF